MSELPATEPPATERLDPRYAGLDGWSPPHILAALWEAQATAIAAVLPALPLIESACAAAATRIAAGGRLGYAGAGTSARIAALDASELPPTFGFAPERIAVLIAGGSAALRVSVEGAEDDAEAARNEVERLGFGNSDVLLGIAASGATPFTVAALVGARVRGTLTIGLASVPGSPLLAAAECPILVATGAEPIAGSTRLKAGTAQKVVLNLFSTLLMVQLGHVHDGMMVDMQPRNAKLRERAQRMVQGLAGCSDVAAAQALRASGGRTKHAVLSLLHGLDAEGADRLLIAHGGKLRAALAARVA